MRRLPGAASWLAFLALAASNCTYDPNFDDGILVCGAGMSCPKGYACATDGACWKNPASGGNVNPLDKYVGTWAFDNGSLASDCSSSEPMMRALVGDYLVVVKYETGLLADYYCEWKLHRAPGATKATLDPAQMCNKTVKDTVSGVDFTYTWVGKTFVFSTTDGRRATLEGHVVGDYTASDQSTGTCDGTFSGQLTKVPQ